MRQSVQAVAACCLLVSGTTFAVRGHAPASEPPAATGTIPSGFGASVDQELVRLRAATAAFKSTDAAISSGYQATSTCVAHPSHGAMGLHYKNPALRDARLDVEQPEILLYAPMPDGSLKLTGVEFIVPFAAWTREEPPTVLMQKLRRAETLRLWYLHVWIWERNSAGIFADWNPDVKC